MNAEPTNEATTDEVSYSNADEATQAISEALDGIASITVKTTLKEISDVIEVADSDEEEALNLHSRTSGPEVVYVDEITEITTSREFAVGDRVQAEDGRRGRLVSINEMHGAATDRARLLPDTGTEMSIPVSDLVLIDEVNVECAGDDCRRPAVTEIGGCVLGDLSYTLRVCQSCARDAE